jgi:hypothetical protein
VATTGDRDAFVSVAARLFSPSTPPVEAVDLQPVTVVPLD